MMKEPRPELRTGADEPSQDFAALASPNELVSCARTREDFFDAVLGLDEPATVEEVAGRADHGRDAAREYLDWFEGMGIVDRVSASPATFRLNREYRTWRRIQRMCAEYDAEELLAHLEEETERDREFATAFGVESPDEVAISERAIETDRSVEDVWN